MTRVHPKSILPFSVLALLAAAVVYTPTLPQAQAADIGYVEDFALAKDRNAALKQLIPGTEDYYYYHALHALNMGRYDAAVANFKPWIERHGHTPRVVEIQVRHALLTYEKNPQASLAFLKNHLGLLFNHQREVIGAIPQLPTVLDQNVISRATLKAYSQRWANLHNYEDSALDWLAADNLDWQRQRHLLQRLQRPDITNLPELIHADMNAEHPSPFGTFPVHTMLTIPQLEALKKLRPALANDSNFVMAYVSKLCPGADSDWKRDRAIARDYLGCLEKFAMPLAPVHNALKAHVLFHRLALDRADGIYDKDRFIAYLQLPRFQPYMAKAWNDRRESQQFPANLTVDFSPHTLLAAPK
ncbi:MAG TPA: hypothetical protein VN641_14495, partial [Urbifossiella sp.]|nr:hypothetical protein [Urbifossiella sp.]